MSKEVVFYYVRHGKTQFNEDQIIQGGRVDSELVPEAVPALQETANALADISFASCYCSPLERAQKSAEIILGERKLRITTLETLEEFDFGELDGQPYKGHRIQFLKYFMKQDFSEVGGESGETVRYRAQKAFSKMYRQAKHGDNILVVGHGAYLRSVLREFSELSRASRNLTSLTMRVPNASITTMVGHNGEIVVKHMPVRARDFLPYIAS